jgi:peptidyl-prolyl cis-trans isomerase D
VARSRAGAVILNSAQPMLQAIRSKATSLVVKILFGILVISFGIWGIGDIFRNRGADTTVATVGSRKITQQELSQAVREDAERLRSMLRGTALDTEQLKQFGIVDAALQRLINRDLVELEINRLRLAMSDEAVRQAIFTNRAFQDESGKFDRNRYQRVLASQHMTEPQFEALLRDDLVRSQLDETLIGGLKTPSELVDALYRSRAERRIAEVVDVPQSATSVPAPPNDTELAAFYEQHKDNFRVPELRSFGVGLLLLDDVAAGIKVDDDKLREEYQARLAEYHTPEERHLQQILLPDEAKAKEAEAQLKSGKDFVQVAHDVAGLSAGSLDLGIVKREELPAPLADVAFSLKSGETSAPVQSTFGWHILRVSEIKPEATQPFEAVKDKLKADVARDMAGDEISQMANKIDDALAGGASFADVAQKFGLKVAQLTDITANGHNAKGDSVELPQPSAEILRTAFTTDAGQTSQLTEAGDAGYYLVEVDKVTPPAFKPLDAVREEVIAQWQSEKRDEALEALAKEMADQANAGRSLTELAALHRLASFTSAPLQRSGGDAKVPPAAVAKIFEAKPGTAIFARGDGFYVVAVVKEVLPPDQAKETEATAQLERQLEPALREELLQQYDQALRERYPVYIDSAALAHAL